ncbi:MAG: DUF2161 family putative PD-(D/E)XK-type phosphodiesterase [Firmicutes bacterium]|jgi:hypothetical protein|nr:DUF2161 family putative PD-(D/E)XK-type phosphodiesterase [Bacillota bacterium]
MKETDLYLPVKNLLEEMEYQVDGEVKDIDVFGLNGHEDIIVELKKDLNFKLILQGAKRQRLSDNVYVAIPKPSFKIRCSKNFKDKEYLLRRLSLGLIFVDFNEDIPRAMIQFEPAMFYHKISQGKSKRKYEKLIKESSARSLKMNKGGTKGKIMTAYKENAMLIAYLLYQEESLTGTPKLLRENGGGEKTGTILNKNYYEWFEKIKRGTYGLTDKGIKAAEEYERIFKKR